VDDRVNSAPPCEIGQTPICNRAAGGAGDRLQGSKRPPAGGLAGGLSYPGTKTRGSRAVGLTRREGEAVGGPGSDLRGPAGLCSSRCARVQNAWCQRTRRPVKHRVRIGRARPNHGKPMGQKGKKRDGISPPAGVTEALRSDENCLSFAVHERGSRRCPRRRPGESPQLAPPPAECHDARTREGTALVEQTAGWHGRAADPRWAVIPSNFHAGPCEGDKRGGRASPAATVRQARGTSNLIFARPPGSLEFKLQGNSPKFDPAGRRRAALRIDAGY
jgi:hypothetical protein